MPVPTFTGLGPNPTFTDLVQKVNKMAQELNNFMVNMDSLNVVALTADHITGGTIDAGVVTVRSDLQDGAYVQINSEGMVINDGTKDTFKADIEGAVTMTSATIQSAAGYPKVVMDPDTNLFAAYSSAESGVEVVPSYISDKPAFRIIDGGVAAGHFAALASGNVILDATNSLTISANNDVFMRSLGFRGFVFESWGSIYNEEFGLSLQSALDNIAGLIDDLNDRVTALEGG